MKLIIKGLLVTSLLATGAVANTDIDLFTSDNNDRKITTKSIEEAFKKAGFFISANRDMNGPFKKQFKESSFDVYNLFTFYKKDVVLELAKKYENIGLFAPMSMSIYTKKGEKKISVSSLSLSAMQKIMKIPADEKILTDLKEQIKKSLKTAMPNGKYEKLSYKTQKATGDLVTNFTMEMDKESWDEELEDLKMGFEGELAPNGFVIAGHNNLGDEFEEKDYNGFDFYEVYSICKLPVIYAIAKTRPEAGAYAPCSLYMAKKKGDNNLKMGFPSVYNWMSSMAIDSKEDIKVLKDAQNKMEKILSGLTE
ncbi:FIG01147157: hypothetical protein [hydrothermal vent metagenome]|uniref:DUF302 domain-containing protein n=1 Tax=hydrothermal vent metagenome TaxID=652676 RepID=A0A1W1BLU2_9ZZZZ